MAVTVAAGLAWYLIGDVIAGIFEPLHRTTSLAKVGGDVIPAGGLQHLSHRDLIIVAIRALLIAEHVEHVATLQTRRSLPVLDAQA